VIELLAILANVAGAIVLFAHVRSRRPRTITPTGRAIVIAVRGHRENP
jgi:hypothetical protein